MYATVPSTVPGVVCCADVAASASLAVAGMDGCPEFEAMSWGDQQTLDTAKLQAETVGVAKALIEREASIGAILLECSLLPPYAAAVQSATGLPVFDFTHLVTLVHDACARQPFHGLT